MAIKADPAYCLDAEGHITLLEVSFVNCCDTDLYRIQGTEGKRFVTIEKKPCLKREDP